MSILNKLLGENREAESRRRLNEMAVEAEAKLRADNPDLLTKFSDELERQKVGFRFYFRRHGDFLTVTLTRNGNLGSEWYPAKTSFVETINLSKVRSIRFEAGHAPDDNGRFSWVWENVIRNESGNIIGSGSGSGYPLWPWDGEIVVRPCGSPTHVQQGRQFIRDYSVKEFGHGAMRLGSEGISHHTADFPQQAKDDTIQFGGLEYAILAPFGLGQAMHDALLAEIARGAPTAPPPVKAL